MKQENKNLSNSYNNTSNKNNFTKNKIYITNKGKSDDNSYEIKKEDFVSKNNNLENEKFLNQKNINEAKSPYQKYYSSDNIDKNQKNSEFSNDDNEENDNDPNPLALTNKKTSGKKIKNLFKSLEECMFTNNNKIKSDLTIKNSIVVNDENNYLENNNGNIRPNIEEVKNNLFNNKIDRTCLENIGDTSYLNSILQCLVNIEILKKFFLESSTFEYISKYASILPLSFSTLRIFYHAYTKKDKLYSLKAFLKALGCKSKIYQSIKSRNSNDCLIFILNSLHNELNRIKEKNEKMDFNKSNRNEVIAYGITNFKNLYDSIISDIFNWHEIKELHCINCGEKNYEFKTFYTYQTNILEISKNINKNNIITISDCINYELRKKKKLYCYRCGNKSDFEIISGIYETSKILVFLLNNGDYDKNLLNVTFFLDEEINLNKFIEVKNSELKYELIGVISINAQDKKYNSFCKSFLDKKWYHYYDQNVNQVNFKEIEFNNRDGKNFIPNILFYKLIE